MAKSLEKECCELDMESSAEDSLSAEDSFSDEDWEYECSTSLESTKI